MTPGSFFKLVELQTKVASVIPFTLGTVYALYRFNNFDLRNFIFMFISLIAFDMATTAVNNYMDYKKAYKTEGYNYNTHNAIVRDELKERTVLITIFILIAVASIFGFILFLNTDFVVLLLGAVSFLIGICYSYGPVPISRTPLGEIFSGLFMGFVIVFISAYIHIYDQNIITIAFQNGILALNFNIIELLYIFLISMPAVIGIANIMLANNICDIEDDIENKRYTLPIYLGKKRALSLFRYLYYLAYLDILALLLLQIVPLSYILTLATIIIVNKNINIFDRKQTKKDTFVLAVKNFVVINVVQILIIGITTIT